MAKTVIIYTRVSGDEQANKGYGLKGQRDETRAFAKQQGWQIIDEIEDPGYERDTMNRRGLDQVRNMVAAGGVDFVLAWQRDRFGAYPIPAALQLEFEEYGTKLKALDDSGDGMGDDGEIIDTLKDVMAKREIRKIAGRTKMGRMRRAREGKIIAGGSPPYGFDYNHDKTNYVVDEPKMSVVRRIFKLVADGTSLYGVQTALDSDRIPTPNGGDMWRGTTLRKLLFKDLYMPHDRDDLQVLVDAGNLAPAVLADLKDEPHGISWFNQLKVKKLHKRTTAGKRKREFTPNDRADWIAIPVPAAGLDRETVDRARAAIAENRWTPPTGSRELSGIIACECGSSVSAKTMKPPRYPYYVCREYLTKGRRGCKHGKHWPAKQIEEQVRQFARDSTNKPEYLAEQVRNYVEEQRRATRKPERDIRAWQQQIADAERDRLKNQQMFRADAMTLDELQAANAELEQQKATAERALADLRDSEQHLQYLDELPSLVTEWIEEFRFDLRQPNPYPEDDPRYEKWYRRDGEMYRALYDDLRFRVVIGEDGTLEITGTGDVRCVVSAETTSRGRARGRLRG